MADSNQFNEREVETRALDRFLTGSKLTRLTGGAARAELARLFRPEVVLAPSELEPYRIMVAWRLARRTAQLKGMLAPDERMEDAFEIEPSPWYAPTKPMLRPGAAAPTRRAKMAAVLLLHEEGDGLALLPPRDPSAAERWCNAYAIAARDLGIEQTEEGCWGLRGLLDPGAAYHNHPTPAQLTAFEELVVIEATEILVTAGERQCVKHFRERYSLTRDEAMQLIRLARARAHEEFSGSVEEDRALLTAYWKDYIERARKEPVGLTHEARGLKELAKVQGVTRTEPEDKLTEFVATVKAVANQARAKQLEQPKPKAIEDTPGGSDIADAEYTVTASEKEAIETYDKENA
jgi:hypothetical protein